VIVATVIAIVLIWKMLKPTEEDPEQDNEPIPEQDSESKTATISRMYKYLIENGVDRTTALVFIAQSMHETGNFKSDLFRKYNNGFGMKQPHKRETTSIGASPTGYAMYDSVESSLADLALWLKEFNSPDQFSSVSQYVSFIKSKGYFEDTLTNYMGAVTKFFNSIKSIS